MKRALHVYPQPILRTPSIPVDFDRDKRDLPKFADDLVETMFCARGAGLSAIQVGLPLRLIAIMDEEGISDVGPYIILANPVIAHSSDFLETGSEGCLSFPDQFIKIERPKSVTLTGFDIHGEPQKFELSGIMARAAQHEIEHLDGKLLIDHASGLQKRLMETRMKKFNSQLRAKEQARTRAASSSSPVGDGEG